MAIESWTFDTAHSTVGFWVRHLMVSKVHGRFTQWSGNLAFDPDHPELSSVEVSIDTASIDTREAQRDTHLRSADFFDVEKFPALTFKSTAVAATGTGHYKVTGDLTLHGVTHPAELAVAFTGRAKHPYGGERLGFEASTSINRSDYGVVWNMVLEAGGLTVSDKVTIDLDVQATRP